MLYYTVLYYTTPSYTIYYTILCDAMLYYTTLVLPWYDPGTPLVRPWYGPGTPLVRPWYDPGITPVSLVLFNTMYVIHVAAYTQYWLRFLEARFGTQNESSLSSFPEAVLDMSAVQRAFEVRNE